MESNTAGEQILRLAPGITLHYLPESRFKSGRLSLCFLSFLGDGHQAEAALLPAVLHRGCRGYPSIRKINRALEELYDPSLDCRVYHMGETRITAFRFAFPEGRFLPEEDRRSGKFLNQNTERGFDLFFSLLLDPLTRKRGDGRFLRSDLLRMEKENLLAALYAEKNDKTAYALRRCTELLCKGEAYSINDLGEEKKIRAVTARSLTAYYHSLLQTQPLEIFYVGSETLANVTGFLRTKLPALDGAQRERMPTRMPAFPQESEKPLWDTEERQTLTQGKLVIGCRIAGGVSHAQLPAYYLFREILSASPISKFFRYVREKEGLCYSCFAAGDAYKGVLFFCAGIALNKREQAKDSILAQLKAMQTGEIDDEEFRFGKKSLCAALRETGETPGAMISYSLRETLWRCPEGPLPLTELLKKIEALSLSELCAFARRVTPQVCYFLRDGAEEETAVSNALLRGTLSEPR